MMQLSIIVTTYNRPEALQMVLQSLAQQKTSITFEVIIADDGSTETTKQLIQNLQPTLPYPLQHIWQPDDGFQAAKIRNKAVACAQGTYLIFLDGDCIPVSTFVTQHLQLAEKKYFVVGNRILLSKIFTKKILEQNLNIRQWSLLRWFYARLKRQCNRVLPLLYFLPHHTWRKRWPQRWQGAKTCNLALWKQDFIRVNGFDERYQGWGYEDSDLVIRLIHAGILRKQGHFAGIPVWHLWHAENDRTQEIANLKRLQNMRNSIEIYAKHGIAQYMESERT